MITTQEVQFLSTEVVSGEYHKTKTKPVTYQVDLTQAIANCSNQTKAKQSMIA